MANTEVTYSVSLKEIRKRVLPDLDDEFAKDLESSTHWRDCASGSARICRAKPTRPASDSSELSC